MTWNPSPLLCEACEGPYTPGRACPECRTGNKTCSRCGWCDECADRTVTVEEAVPYSERERIAVLRHKCPRCGIPKLNRCRASDGTLLEYPHAERAAKVSAVRSA